MPNFSRKLINLLPILLFVVGLNYYEDPAKLFRHSYEQGIADLLLSGKNVEGITNYDERILQKYIIKELTAPKDIIVLGSSRSMLISSALFPAYTFLNNSVSGGGIQDYIAMSELYYEGGIPPRTVLICLDPWVLNRYNNQDRWQTLATEYQNGVKRIGNQPEELVLNALPLKKYLELFSPAYFQSSLRQYLKNINDPSSLGYYATEDMYGDDVIKRSDGSLAYQLEFRSASSREVLDKAINYVSKDPVYSLGKFEQLDADYVTATRDLVEYLTQHGVQVVLYLPPYHPYVYEQLINSDKYEIILDAQEEFIQIATENKSIVVGSYDPADIPCSMDEFYDGMHPQETCIKRIFLESGLMTR